MSRARKLLFYFLLFGIGLPILMLLLGLFAKSVGANGMAHLHRLFADKHYTFLCVRLLIIIALSAAYPFWIKRHLAKSHAKDASAEETVVRKWLTSPWLCLAVLLAIEFCVDIPLIVQAL